MSIGALEMLFTRTAQLFPKEGATSNTTYLVDT